MTFGFLSFRLSEPPCQRRMLMTTAARSSVLCVIVVTLAMVVSCACSHPPSISSISPNSATTGGGDFTLTINGNNFESDSTVDFNGTILTPSFINSQQLTATIPSTNIAESGTFQVLVLNPPTNGSSSNVLDGTSVTTQSNTCGGHDSNAVSFTVSQ